MVAERAWNAWPRPIVRDRIQTAKPEPVAWANAAFSTRPLAPSLQDKHLAIAKRMFVTAWGPSLPSMKTPTFRRMMAMVVRTKSASMGHLNIPLSPTLRLAPKVAEHFATWACVCNVLRAAIVPVWTRNASRARVRSVCVDKPLPMQARCSKTKRPEIANLRAATEWAISSRLPTIPTCPSTAWNARTTSVRMASLPIRPFHSAQRVRKTVEPSAITTVCALPIRRSFPSRRSMANPISQRMPWSGFHSVRR